MKILFALALLASNVAWADCPDFSGSFLFRWSGHEAVLTVEQTGCSSIRIEEEIPGFSAERFTFITDGKKHELENWSEVHRTAVARWDGDALVYEMETFLRQSETSYKTSTRIEMDADGNLIERRKNDYEKRAKRIVYTRNH